MTLKEAIGLESYLQIVPVARKDVARRVLVVLEALPLVFVGLSFPTPLPTSVRGFGPCRPVTKLDEFRLRTVDSAGGAACLDTGDLADCDWAGRAAANANDSLSVSDSSVS